MARIRTIKPEFWTDEKVVRLPYEARLLFIGLWNFCDDDGYMWDEPDRIKMQVLPGDPVDTRVLLDLLAAAGLIDFYATEDPSHTAIAVRHFSDHQRVDHPAKSKISREASRKLAMPSAVRRAVAQKYGCAPGETVTADCYYCGAPGEVVWWRTTSGRPGSWVSFSHEIDHLQSESNGGVSDCSNLVLACRECNRSKGKHDFISFLLDSREGSRGLAPEGKGREWKGMEEERQEPATTKTEKRFLDTFREKEDDLRELFPHHDYEVEKATCIAHYRSQPPPIDPYVVVVKWFRRASKRPVVITPQEYRQTEQELREKGLI